MSSESTMDSDDRRAVDTETALAPITGPWARLGQWFVALGLWCLRLARGAREQHYVAPDGVDMRYLRVRRPGRPTAVLLHGFSDRPESFLAMAGSLRGYDLILPELPGFHDGVRSRSYTVGNYAAWVAHLLDDLGVRDVHICGNSLGGATAMKLAEQRPDLVRTLLPLDAGGVEAPGISSIHDEVRSGVNLFEVREPSDLTSFMERIFHRAPPLHGPLRAWLAQDLSRKADQYAWIMSHLEEEGMMYAERGSVVELDSLQLPVLVAWGEHDSLFPLGVGEYIAERIPTARLHVFRATGHCPHIERPFAMGRLCREFWCEVDG